MSAVKNLLNKFTPNKRNTITSKDLAESDSLGTTSPKPKTQNSRTRRSLNLDMDNISRNKKRCREDEEDGQTICPKCDVESEKNDDLTCKHCNQTYHIHCQKISSVKLQLLRQAKEEGEDDIYWICSTCQKASESIHAGLTMMYTRLDDMDTKVTSFGESMKKLIKQKKSDKAELKRELAVELRKELTSELANKVEEVKEEVKKLGENQNKLDREVKTEVKRLEETQSKIDDKLHTKVNTIENKVEAIKEEVEQKHKNQTIDSTLNVIRELRDQEKRRHNLMVYNLRESTEDTEEKQIEHDIEEVTKMCDAVCDFTVTICKAERCGKNNNGQRPLKIQLVSEDQCFKVLRNSWEIGKPTADRKRVFINKDETPLEQGRRRALVAELKKKQEETVKQGGKELWMIKWGKVVEKPKSAATQK